MFLHSVNISWAPRLFPKPWGRQRGAGGDLEMVKAEQSFKVWVGDSWELGRAFQAQETEGKAGRTQAGRLQGWRVEVAGLSVVRCTGISQHSLPWDTSIIKNLPAFPLPAAIRSICDSVINILTKLKLHSQGLWPKAIHFFHDAFKLYKFSKRLCQMKTPNFKILDNIKKSFDFSAPIETSLDS